jgi:HAD superfamily hydrolase (TIGR01549 family)
MSGSVFADQLAGALDAHAAAVDVLSLDCFDTLIWRTTPEPPDLFCQLSPPLSRLSRMVAEQTARERRLVKDGLGEVTLPEIYRCALPSADSAEIERRVAEELALEHAHCVAFAPAVQLIRRAKALGKRVVVVSDTYLRTEELRALLQAKLGDDVLALIDRIYCSSAHGKPKSMGLFKHVVADLKVQPGRILHIGDNPKADVDGALKAGLMPLLLLQGDAELTEQWRLEMAALLMTESGLRHRAMPLLPQRPGLALQARSLDEPAARLGCATMGPIMDGFVRWVRDEARALAAGGRKVKLCFLMRDGHLPLQAYKALAGPGDPPAVAIELSRFVAFAASFGTLAEVDAYLGMMADTVRLDALARQLQFNEMEMRALLPGGGRALAVHEFGDRVRRPANLQKVLDRSAQARERLFTYLGKQVDPQPGEVLLLVDIGAAGTVQNRVQAIVEARFGVTVAGRYLLLRDVPRAHEAKRGFFGPDRLDGRLLEGLYSHIAVVEQLCTVEQGSVVGYDADGVPQRKSATFNPAQGTLRQAVQQACIRYVAERAGEGDSAGAEGRWQGALAAFSRLLFLPLRSEIGFFEQFAHDMNLGVKETVPMIDRAAAAEDLRRIGPLYAKTSQRIYTPAELRDRGLDLALLQFVRRRLDLDLRPQDYRSAGAQLSVMVARGQDASIVQIDTMATHDGFVTASIPIGRCEFAIGLLVGRQYEWLQLESARVALAKHQFDSNQRLAETDVTASAVYEGVQPHAGGLVHCPEPQGFIYFAPPTLRPEANCVLRVVFRPLVERAAVSATKAGERHASMESR